MNAECQYWPASVDLFIIFRGQGLPAAPAPVHRPEISAGLFPEYRADPGLMKHRGFLPTPNDCIPSPNLNLRDRAPREDALAARNRRVL